MCVRTAFAAPSGIARATGRAGGRIRPGRCRFDGKITAGDEACCGGEGGAGLAHGVVRWFNGEKGFGFIAPDDGGRDVFVQFSEIVASGYRTLVEGLRVEFEVVRGRQGTHALNVRVVLPPVELVKNSALPRFS